jgi:hypothetical protein
MQVRGTQVLVRAFGNKALIRLIWDFDDDTVSIVTEANYHRLQSGAAGLRPVAFPRADVYAYDEAAAAVAIEGEPLDAATWAGLTRWEPGAGDEAGIVPQKPRGAEVIERYMAYGEAPAFDSPVVFDHTTLRTMTLRDVLARLNTAHDQLAALEALYDDWNGPDTEAMRQARDAIAKAKG